MLPEDPSQPDDGRTVISERIAQLRFPTWSYDPAILAALPSTLSVFDTGEDSDASRRDEWIYFAREYRARAQRIADYGRTKNKSFLNAATLVLVEIGGFSIDQVAAIFRAPKPTINKRLEVARRIARHETVTP